MKVAAADGCLGVDVDGRRYNTDRHGHIDLPKGAARKAVAAGGAFIPGTGFGHVRGFLCPTCGFRPLFNRCSRCGATAIREDS